MQAEEIQALVKKYLDGTATPEEKQLLGKWYQEGRNDPAGWFADEANEEELLRLEMLREIKNRIGLQTAKQTRRLWPRIAAAASIILCIAVGGYFIARKQPAQQIAQNQLHDIAPGGNKAILKSRGKQFIVTNARNGLIAQSGSTLINKTAAGRIVYNVQRDGGNIQTVYDTLVIPRGGQMQLVFSDGSKAWLNSETTIRYPEKFTGKNRTVELLTGEAYFEVIHKSKMPFRVIAKNVINEDIGTHFNVNAYPDEAAIKTTLLEGSVKVFHNKQDRILKPGQQSVIKANSTSIIIKETDLDEAIAWKNNYFIFNDESIESIMRKVARWYDVDVTYRGDLRGKEFVGSVSRFKYVSDVLRKLEATGTIHFKIEGRRIVVMP